MGSLEKCLSEECPARIVRCEEVLRSRTGRLLIVLDRVCDAHNIAAALRTSEALGVQNVWIVSPTMGIKSLGRPRRPRELQSIAKGSDVWLTVAEFQTPEDCLKALREGGWSVWVTGDGRNALSLASPRRPEGIDLEKKVAVVIGRETDGVCDEFAKAADRQVYVEMTGFTASLNLSVATALIVQRIFDWFPEFKGDLTDEEKVQIRTAWRQNVAKNPAAREKLSHWFDHPELIPLQKRPKTTTTAISSGSWAPKYIRDRDSAAAAKRAGDTSSS